jgi:hypothetical protein
MTSFLKRAVSALRSWIGLPDVPTIELPMTPPHGWLLPAPVPLHGVRAAVPRDGSAPGRRR